MVRGSSPRRRSELLSGATSFGYVAPHAAGAVGDYEQIERWLRNWLVIW